jgi:hypothetical protein
VQVPQLSEPSQPFEIVPQFLPCAAHVVGVHGVMPQTFGVVPPQTSGCVQAPQFRDPPQLFEMTPQFFP